MVHFSHTGVIQAAPADVFSVVADPAKIKLWRKDVPAVTQVSGPAAVGQTYLEEVHFGGVKQLLMEVVEFSPATRLVVKGVSGMPLLPTQTFRFKPHAQGCELTLEVDMRVSGSWVLITPLLPFMLKKIWKGYFVDLDGLFKQAGPL